ncbi:hypothetical protein [Propionivibrio sp.]|uniref:hypothetical protein n=1 Tax=Propionivibrio sp. TaxID=2212460 RepID=UPI003BF00D47
MTAPQLVLVEIGAGNALINGIAGALSLTNLVVVRSVQILKRRRFVVSEAYGVYRPTAAGSEWLASGRIIPDGHSFPRPRTQSRGLRQRAWWVIRARRTVTLPGLLTSLADGTEKNASGNLSKYLRSLSLAGFLKVLALKAGNGVLRYQVVRNNGRGAPVVRQAVGEVYDPNTGEVFKMDGVKQSAEEVAA